ncbi:hypothetical protein OB919_01775 [Halobacteria archaeon AArc-curdl1]|uniref:Acetyl-CoA synthetase n=1 Tax=Natronosalvus hydrolyticus TaxID=2979988 RepID=A0AAP3E5H9_9EURY|nr:hypothetical protein [Halobacteria archaeon AArc-curdl1]
MEKTLDAYFGRESRTDRPALEDATGRQFDAHWLRTTAWKAGNFLRHTGVRRDVTVGIAGSGPLPTVAFFGTALLEGTTCFDPPRDEALESVRTLVAPTADLETYATYPGLQRIGYGDNPDEPAARHLESGLWSENPSFPPVDIAPDTPLLVDPPSLTASEATVYSHQRVLAAANSLVERWGVETGDRIALEPSLEDPRAVTAGLIAPLLADAVTVFPGAETEGVDLLIVDGDSGSGGDTSEESTPGNHRTKPVGSLEADRRVSVGSVHLEPQKR